MDYTACVIWLNKYAGGWILSKRIGGRQLNVISFMTNVFTIIMPGFTKVELNNLYPIHCIYIA